MQNFITALIKSGVAAEVERGLIFVVGNSGVGKTSLVNTLDHFVKNPTENPESKLTKIIKEVTGWTKLSVPP